MRVTVMQLNELTDIMSNPGIKLYLKNPNCCLNIQLFSTKPNSYANFVLI